MSPHRLAELGYSYRAARVVMSAVELDLFTILANGPLGCDAITQWIGLHVRGAGDFLDALVALRLLDRDESGNYRNTPEAGEYLDRKKPAYLGCLVDHMARSEYPRWASLTNALRTGQSQTGAGASGNYPSLYADPKTLDTFVRGMTGASLPCAAALAVQFPWLDHATVIDIGTAEGAVPAAVAQAHPHLTGGGFDLPPIEPAFRRYVAERNLSGRLRFYPGDFFSDSLPGADVLIMGRVLHNWNLAIKLALLRKAHAALPGGGALIVYERLIDDARRTGVAGLLSSLNMLVMTPGGFDFTGADCIGWMRETGFRDMRVEPLTDDHAMVVGYK